MLSPADYHKIVPKDPRENLRFRRWLVQRCMNDPAAQAAMREACKRDILFYINAFVFQYNPAHVGHEVGPFITWPEQDEIILATIHRLLVERGDALWEKSREMGGTWKALLIKDWTCQFHDHKKVLAISHSEDAVDRPGDPDSLFWRLQFVHENQPDWLSCGVFKRKLAFSYPHSKSSFNGAATSERSGVGGRATCLMLDEFSKHRQDYEILGQTADTGPRLFIGTHYGVGTQFYKLTQRPDMWKRVLHWSQHPEKRRGLYRWLPDKNQIDVLDKTYVYPPDFHFMMTSSPLGGPFPGLRSPWYDKECERRANSRDVAMHLDINPQGSVSQFFEPAIIRSLIGNYCRPPVWEGELDYDHGTGEPVCLVTSPGGTIHLWVMPDKDGLPPVGKYAFGCDVSAGTGTTNSCASAMNVQTGEKVLEYANANIDAKSFAPLVVALCRLFKAADGEGATLGWEIPGPGKTFGETAVELGYRNILKRPREDLVTKEYTEKIGWAATPETKRALLEEYRAAIYTRKMMNFSEKALEECLLFKYDDRGYPQHGGEDLRDDPSGAKVNHGDRVIADGIAWMLGKGQATRIKREEAAVIPIHSLAWRRKIWNDRRRQEEWA